MIFISKKNIIRNLQKFLNTIFRNKDINNKIKF